MSEGRFSASTAVAILLLAGSDTGVSVRYHANRKAVMVTYLQREKRRRVIFWSAVVLLTGTAAVVSYYLTGPPPPKKIRLATGQPGGAYASFGQQYAQMLGRNGLDVEPVPTLGSVDNLRRLIKGEVDVAFVQGGTYGAVADSDPAKVVRGIAAIGLEPVWVFYRQSEQGGLPSDVHQFRDCELAIGKPMSGTNVISRLILEVNGIDDENTALLELPMAEAATRLEQGTIDAAFFVSSYQGRIIQNLLDSADDELHLLGFRRYEAYVRLFPYLKPVELSEGMLDLQSNLPSEPSALLAPSVLLACRQDTHPRVVEQFISAARSIHADGNLLTRPTKFPTLDGMDLTIHHTADAYVRSGESLMSRLVPYWAMHWVVRTQFLLLPLLTLWIPFFKILPLLYRYRIGTLLKKHYAALRDVETGIKKAHSKDELGEVLDSLHSLRDDMERLSRKIPAFYQQDVYHWRAHVAMVQDELSTRLNERDEESESPTDGANHTEET